MTVKKGEQVAGQLTMSPNPNNKRDLNFTINVNFTGELMQCQLEQNYRMR